MSYPESLVADWRSQIRFGEEVVSRLQIFVDNWQGVGLTAEQRLWLHHRLRAMPYRLPDDTIIQIDMLNFLICGEVKAAYALVHQIQPDPMDKPYHCFSQMLIDDLKRMLEEYLGIV